MEEETGKCKSIKMNGGTGKKEIRKGEEEGRTDRKKRGLYKEKNKENRKAEENKRKNTSEK